ncbi:hypothetical protein AB79_5382 [Escherichia coli 6-175-07_S1_C3]|nr:hypothetical protein AB14_3802 [Escherichia coli 1-392-07_S1_C1]KDW81039.1 hypothetical protein AB42_4028 [Escherichia coli 1-392-07_S1_C2]KEJ19614.1 hypothetical protein AB50_5410 [Escherichia coli 6-175-07_S1_C2]KEM46525.1 hypothetical protein AB79_5382 [Escherichia coli 6-175-07_S1_C3]
MFSYLFRKRRGEIKFILFLSGVGQRAKRGVSQEVSRTGPDNFLDVIKVNK